VKSVLAVLAGAVFILAATFAVDSLLRAAGVLPPMDRPVDQLQAVLGTSYRVVLGVAGAWLTARLAPRTPMRHALTLGGIGTVLGLAALLATWNKDLGPRWYGIAHVVLALPEAWLGARLHLRRRDA